MSSIDALTHKSVATWIRHEDYAILQELAAKNKVTVATYMRAIIVDAIQDEIQIANTIAVNCIAGLNK